MAKHRYVYGIRLVECECGVWRVAEEPLLPCWGHEKGKQLTVEAIATLNQSIRNLGYAILSSLKIIRRK